jgi:hypothetical protein
MSGKLKVEFIPEDGTQFDDNAALVKYGGGSEGGKLYIGDRFSASYVQLKARKCKAVVCCDQDIWPFCKETEVSYLKIDPSDEDDDHFEESYAFIDRNLAKKRSVVVHDEAGVGKAVVIIIYFLMTKSKKSLGEAYKQVKKLRGELKIPPSLVKKLMKVEKQRTGVNSISLQGKNVTVLGDGMLGLGGGVGGKKQSNGLMLVGLIVVGFFVVLYAVLVALTGKA